MLFVIYAKDKTENTKALRDEHYPAHKAHLEQTDRYGVEVITSGPLVSDDGKRAVGSLIICQAEARKDVAAFHKDDPFYKAGIWQMSEITAFDKRRG